MANNDISSIVNVTVALDTAPIPQAGFDTVMFLAETKVFTDRWNIYNSADAMLQDGFLSTDPAYKAYVSTTSGTTRPKTVIIARRKFDTITYTPTVANNEEYSLQIAAPQAGFETFSYTSDGTATATEIVDGIVADFTANASVGLAAVVALSNVSDELQLTDIGGSDYAVKEVSTNLNPTSATKADFETIPTALSEVKGEDGVWAYFGIESRILAEAEAAADYAESNKEIFGTATKDPNGKIANQSTILDTGFANGYNYTIGLWSNDADSYPEMAMLARLAVVQVPGQTTLHGQRLAGVTVDKDSTLTGAESVVVQNKNANTYELYGSTPMVQKGVAFSGEFIDNVDLARWLKARIQENVFQLVAAKAAANSKIPYTDSGLQLVGTRIVEIVKQGIEAGVLDGNYNNGLGYILDIPELTDIPTNDIANRVLNNVSLTVRATGGIRTINISGTLTI